MKFLKIKSTFFIIFSFLLLFFSIVPVDAAQLSIESSASEIKIGDTVTFTVFVNSDGESINNIEGQIDVPQDFLTIQSVNSSGSIINLWVEQPAQSSNTISFNGGITNPGYTGARGKAISFTARALKSGTASIIFKSGSVRANDGLGTDVLERKTNSSITIKDIPVIVPTPLPQVQPVAEVPQTESVSKETPKAPNIKSSLQDSNTWYNEDSVTFSWDLPRDATSVRTLFDQKSDTTPSVVYTPPVYSKNIDSLEEGVWFFHLQYKTPLGWSTVGHKEIKIDTTLPEKPVVTYEVVDSGLVQINLNSKDNLSGLSKYILSVKDKKDIEINNIQEDGSAQLVFPFDYIGTHVVQIKTFDGAGNTIDSSIVIDFPINEKYKDSLVAKEKNTGFQYGFWLDQINNIPSFILLLLAIIICLFIKKRFFTEEETDKDKRMKKIENDTIALIDSLKENMLEDISLFKVDRNIKDTNEAEEVLLKNLLQDFKTVEKVISTRLKKGKTDKKQNKDITE